MATRDKPSSRSPKASPSNAQRKATSSGSAARRAPTRSGTAPHQASHKAPTHDPARLYTSNARIKRVCLLTGGGDAPGLNAVIRAFVRASDELGLEVYGSEDGFDGLVQPGRMHKLESTAVRGILARGGTILGCSNTANPFAYPTRHGDRVTHKDMSDVVLQRLRDHAIDVLVAVGGDGTMTHALRLQKMGVPVIGVPKTIDNDLFATDLTFGFDTAVNTATWAIDSLHSTAEAHDRVMIVELMGRNAGWIAACAGIAGGADVILIPEIPYDLDKIVQKIQQRASNGAHFSIVVIGEGAKPKGGALSTISKGSKGHLPRLGGAGHLLALLLEGRVPHEIRVTVLGHLQRGGSPSAYDRVLGTRFGVKAARMAKAGRTGRMISLRGQDIVSVALEEAVGKSKLVPVDGELLSAAELVGISLAR